MSNKQQQTQLVVDRYKHLAQKVAALQSKMDAGTITLPESSFLHNFERQLKELAIEVVQAKIAANEWPPKLIMERMGL